MAGWIAFCVLLLLPPMVWLAALAAARRWRWFATVLTGVAAAFAIAAAAAAFRAEPLPGREGPETRGEFFLVSLVPGLGLASLLSVAFTPQLFGLRRPDRPNDASHD